MILPDIETYIEVMAGWREPITLKKHFWSNSSPLKLANYDVQVLESMGEQLNNLIGLTDRQATLAERLIVTYARQLTKIGIEQPNHKNYRIPIRQINRSKSLTLNEQTMEFRFPYDESLINQIKDLSKSSRGAIFWDAGAKAWVFGLTEYNVSCAVALAGIVGAEIDPEIARMFSEIRECEEQGYKIELQLTDTGVEIVNAPSSMLDYISANFGFDDLVTLVDAAGMMGYTVSDEIRDCMVREYGEEFVALCLQRTIDSPPDDDQMNRIFDWAIATQRLPICIYNPNFVKYDKEELFKKFKAHEVQILKANSTFILEEGVKVVYTNRVLNWEGRLPLLVTMANLLHGPAKRKLVSQAEKVVYYCATLPR